jgi:neopullulanase
VTDIERTVRPSPPGWVADSVFYQVFPDRFARSGRVAAPGPLQDWDAAPDHWSFKGGDLFGVADRLDDLADLGISGIYLNPVFRATSNHRYNASEYEAVDPLLGGDAALRELIDAAHDRGIRIVLDGVFNHCGRGFGPFQHLLENGVGSPYRDWFYLDDDVLAGRRRIDAFPADGHDGPPGYRSWWNHQALPKLRVEHPPVREYLLGIAERWLRFGIDGWRLDVPADVEDPTFWPAFRQRVREISPDAYLVGEIWDEAPDWLTGDRFDALMNYPLGIAILGFASAGILDQAAVDSQSDYRRALRAIDGAAFGARVAELIASVDPAVAEAQYNLIGSHDTPRARRVLAGDVAALRLAMLLLLTLPGAPSIYYGDELAMDGGPDPDCRRGYPTGPDANALDMRAFVRTVIAARREHAALRRGSVRVLGADGGAVALARAADGHEAIVAVNTSRQPARLVLASAIPAGLAAVPLPSIATGQVSGEGALDLPAQGALVLVGQAA